MSDESGSGVYGGLIRYYDDYKSKLVLKPIHVILMAIVLIFVIILLHATAPVQ